MNQMLIIDPITLQQQQQVIDRVADLLGQCQYHFGQAFKPVDVRFDLHGRSSGMYVLKYRQRYLRFNPFIFAKFFDDSLATTVPHEVAHYVSDTLFGIRDIRPHGKEWQAIMHKLGVEPKVTGNYDLSGVPVKQQRRFAYACECMTHQLTTIRHNKITTGKARYFCQKCDRQLNRKTAVAS